LLCSELFFEHNQLTLFTPQSIPYFQKGFFGLRFCFLKVLGINLDLFLNLLQPHIYQLSRLDEFVAKTPQF
jgi:hypothetical protein